MTTSAVTTLTVSVTVLSSLEIGMFLNVWYPLVVIATAVMYCIVRLASNGR